MPTMYSPYNRPKRAPEVNSGELVTESAGYIPAKNLIEGMLQAGQRLGEYRDTMYDYQTENAPEDIEMSLDPTRTRNFDMADASAIENAVTNNLKEQEKKAKEEKKKNDERKKAAEKAAKETPVEDAT